MTHIVAISDLHGNLPEIPECDLLLIGGDITPVTNHNVLYQRDWLHNEFSNWLMGVPAKTIVGVGGNHDFVLESDPTLGRQLPWTYLDNSETTVGNLKIWGSPLSNLFLDWAFMETEENLSKVYKTIPRDIDILITHGPPYGYGDRVPDKWSRGRDPHVGSTSLTHQLENEEWPNLRLHVFGHIHGGYGIYPLKGKELPPYVMMVNAAHVNEDYKPVQAPREVEIP